jgi:hypothetical protein
MRYASDLIAPWNLSGNLAEIGWKSNGLGGMGLPRCRRHEIIGATGRTDGSCSARIFGEEG